MIFGIGSDIAHIPRFERLFAKQGERFAAHILTPVELTQFKQRHARSHERGIRFLATRFAAKEAFSKACGLGIRMPMHWHTVQVVNLPSGKPTMQGLGVMAAWLEERQLTTHLTMSDELEYAVAYAMLETLHAHAH
jgi:holo-[acyl-carrier protein] synthase